MPKFCFLATWGTVESLLFAEHYRFVSSRAGGGRIRIGFNLLLAIVSRCTGNGTVVSHTERLAELRRSFNLEILSPSAAGLLIMRTASGGGTRVYGVCANFVDESDGVGVMMLHANDSPLPVAEDSIQRGNASSAP